MTPRKPAPPPEPGVLRLRAHHLLCLLGFRGLGYSEAFVANMTRVADKLRAQPDTVVELVANPDVICAACPKLHGDRCGVGATCGRAEERDTLVLGFMGLTPGARLPVRAAYDLVRERINREVMADECCRGCSWFDLGYCTEGLASLAKRQAETK